MAVVCCLVGKNLTALSAQLCLKNYSLAQSWYQWESWKNTRLYASGMEKWES